MSSHSLPERGKYLPLFIREGQLSYTILGMGKCLGLVAANFRSPLFGLKLCGSKFKQNKLLTTIDRGLYFAACTHYPVKDLWRGKAESPSWPLSSVLMKHATCCHTPISVIDAAGVSRE